MTAITVGARQAFGPTTFAAILNDLKRHGRISFASESLMAVYVIMPTDHAKAKTYMEHVLTGVIDRRLDAETASSDL